MDLTSGPTIKKAREVRGKTLFFRNASVEDAQFILSLRTQPEKSRYLSATSEDIGTQRDWLDLYSRSHDQAYFIIEFQGQAIGTVRLYDAQQASFCWGSWILSDSRPTHAAMESALMVYSYAIDYLGFESAHFDVRKANERVWNFHERFGSCRFGETELDYLYRLDPGAIRESRARYSRYLRADDLVVDW
jgi:RimJ/RimL family protein N-acetyltransferase